jgi:hypothetical protein
VNQRYSGISSFIAKLSICFLIIFIFVSMYTDAKVGFDMSVMTNDSDSSSIWGESLTTVALGFRADSQCTGTGNSSKYVHISNFAGLGLKETGYSKEGRLIDSNTLSISSKEKYVYINETVSKRSTEYEADIMASMPTVLYSTDDLYYRGDGINIRSSYINDNDRIFTGYSGTTLTKSVKYGGVFNDTRVFVRMDPKSVEVLALENRSTGFSVSSSSDRSTKLKFISDDDFIEHDYKGAFKLETHLMKGHGYIFKEDEMGSLSCCFGGWNDMMYYDQKGFGKSTKDVFDCTRYNVSYELASSNNRGKNA